MHVSNYCHHSSDPTNHHIQIKITITFPTVPFATTILISISIPIEMLFKYIHSFTHSLIHQIDPSPALLLFLSIWVTQSHYWSIACLGERTEYAGALSTGPYFNLCRGETLT